MVILRALDEADVIDRLCAIIESIAEATIEENDKFTIGLSGGSLIKYLCDGLPKIKTDWSKWTLFFCDERVVPENSEDSTFGAYKKGLLSNTPLSESQFITIKQGVSAQEAAIDYAEKIATFFKRSDLPKFDLLLLGMGPDGHTCSLFPNHPLLEEKKLIIAPITDSPKPPPERITMTLPVINNANACLFAISGKSKAQMVKAILEEKEDLPATRVKPVDGVVYWIVDNDAAELLNKA